MLRDLYLVSIARFAPVALSRCSAMNSARSLGCPAWSATTSHFAELRQLLARVLDAEHAAR
jgi:hypothetical protein